MVNPAPLKPSAKGAIMIHMKLLRTLSITVALYLLFVIAGVRPFAQTKHPARASHVNDFASVVDDSTRARLENILENLQRKTGVQFDLATVQSTEGRDIFNFSQELAHDWDVGNRKSNKKSLLLVVSVDEKTSFTQFSKGVQPDLPEGLLGDIAQRMRTMLNSGHVSAGVTDAVERFVSALGRKMAFNLEDLDKTTTALASAESSHSETPSPASAIPATSENLTQVVLKGSEGSRQRTVKTTPSPTPENLAASRGSAPETRGSTDDEDEAEEVEVTLALPLAERITTLKQFIEEHPKSKSLMRARELLVSSHAALGDSLLRNRDTTGGLEELKRAIDDAPVDASDKLYTGVIAQIPLNLYLRDEKMAAFEAAQRIEEKFGKDAKRLVGLTNFYLGIERADEAARLAAKAIGLSPNSAEAHYSLGLALHISLRLDEAVAEYKQAIELDSNFRAARRSLADLNRATGKAEEALSFYREQVAAEPKDKVARTGLILTLLDLSHGEEADKELEAALKDDEKNVTLLAGAAYWFAAHKNTKRGLELAKQAVDIEPRYTWSQIALARSLVGENRPLDAERAIRFARQYGKFSTLEYELASVLSALGLYDEAAEILTQSFTLDGDEVETKLAGRTWKRADNFIDLLAPERQASLFQVTAADTPENAKTLKALLAFSVAANNAASNDETLVATAKAFAAGDDKMRTYRQLYVASRLLRMNKGLDTVRELAEAASNGVDEAMDTPAVTVAAQADELRDIRARAIASGGTPDIPEAPREVLANIIRGRIEDVSGWVLFNQDKYTEAAEHLQRAANVLPEATPSWRAAMWHLGAALEQTGRKEDALNAYIKSYLSGERDLARRALIERLYTQVNGSLDGLDQRIGPPPLVAASPTSQPASEAAEAAKPSPEIVEQQPATGNESRSTSEKPVSTDSTQTTKPEASPADLTPAPSQPADPQATPTPEEPPPTETPSPKEEPTPESSPSTANEVESRPLTAEPTLADVPVKAPTSLRLTGRIKDTAGNGIPNVVIVLISPRGSVLASTTDTEGNYSFTVSPSEKPFRLVPSKDGFVFEPIDKTVVITTEDRAVNFFGRSQP